MLSMDKFVGNYVEELTQLLDDIDADAIKSFYDALMETSKNNSRVYIIGNGGSAATASHMANDLKVGLGRRDIVNIDAVSLADNSSVVTAIANDIGFENIFYMQLKDVLKPKDIVIAISCSGNSPSIINAVNYAKDCGNKIVGLTGFDGGELLNISDVKIHIDTSDGKYGLVEDIHMIVNHMLFSYFQEKIHE